VLVISSNGIIRFAPVLTGEGDSFYERHKPKVATGALCRFEWIGKNEGAGEWDKQKWYCEEWNVKPSSD
jgi:probable phosphoglycerate mutase